MPAPSVTNRFSLLSDKEENFPYRANVNFDDLLNYISQRNNGTVAWDNVVTLSPWVDVRAYNSINEAVTAIGTTQTVLLVPNAQTLTANLTIPSTLALWIPNGGSIVKASTYTLTINGPVIAQDYQIFSGFSAGNVTGIQTAYPDWFGTGTTAFQSALDSLVVGGKLTLAAKQYVTTTVFTVNTNRLTIEGVSPSSSVIAVNAAANGATAFAVATGLDNVVFRNFTLNHSNPDVRTGVRGFNVLASVSETVFDRVYVTGFNGFGIKYETGCHYIIIKGCRLLNINDATSTNRPTAIHFTASNFVDIHDCRFGNNDQDINVLAGSSIHVYANSFESGGVSGNTAVDYFVRFNEVYNGWFSNNYVEGNDTPNAFLLLDDCKTPLVEENYFNGNLSASTVTTSAIRVSGTSRFPVIKNNAFIDVISYFVDDAVAVKLQDNYYEDATVEKNTYALVSPYISDLTKLDIDLMGDYATSSTITGWTTPTAKIWFEKMDDIVHVSFEITGTSNAITVSFTLPFANASDWAVHAVGFGHDNSADLTTPIYISVAASSSTCNIFKTFSAGTWTNANNKKVYGQFFYKA